MEVVEIQGEIDRIVERSVRPLLLFFAVLFVGLAVLTSLVGEMRRPSDAAFMVGLSLVSSVVLFLVWFRLGRGARGGVRSETYVAGLAILLSFTSTARLYLTDDPALSIAAIVMTVVWGLFILSPRTLLITQVVQVGLWSAAVRVSEAPRIAWIRMGVGLAVAIGIAHLIQRVRIRGIRSDVERRAALTQALAEIEARTKELTAANTALQRSNEELDAFTRTVAHDLKTPLGAITGYAMLLREDGSELEEEERRRLLGVVEATGHKMAEIIDELLLLASVRRERVEAEPVDMAVIVQGALDRLAYQLDHSDAALELPRRWPAVWGHAPWIEAVWTNYLSNAIKYGGTPPRIVLGAEEGDGQVRFWIRDNGEGLREEEQAQLFTPFSRLESDRAVQGHGLGLSIVQRIIDRLGGEVGLRSTPGEGSEFFFTLPALDVSRDPPGTPEAC